MLLTFALVAILFYAGNFKLKEEERRENARLEKIQNTLATAGILAQAVSVYDLSQNKKIYGKNDEVALPLASLAKIMTVAVALRNHSLDDVVLVTPLAVNQSGDYGILVYEKWKIKDLAEFTLISSANDGAYALAQGDESFLEKMNSKAKKIGAENTSFLDFTGLDINTNQAGLPAEATAEAGAFASASDVNTMAFYALRAYPAEISNVTTLPEINLTSVSGFVHNFKNTNILIGKIPNLLFSKTGFTDIAGGNLTIIFKDRRDHEIAVTVLGSTFDGRFSDMEKIVNLLYSS